MYFLINQIEYIKNNNIDGLIAEVGVFKGTTAKLFHQAFPDRELLLFDTFDGFDERDINHEKENSRAKSGGWNSSLDNVKDFIGSSKLVQFFPGYFPETAENINPNYSYALVHLDADLYNPQISGLEYFYKRIVRGGVLIVHDCNNEYFKS